ncbi:dirigent protein 17-like [Forsythia ovata]|uniref:Dirigent protein 17-like n=1 Tax=Forsythia ovata TaxID=205694 RepID=A0ABD1SST1_9LAMI
MDNTGNADLLESSSTGIFEIPGEPTIVINGLPPLSSGDDTLIPCAVTSAEPQTLTGFGDWLEGREVRKLFGEQLYNGKVAEFDKDMGWYRVVYEDGDFEDLNWGELQQVLLPLEITIPLKTLAMKVIKKRQKSIHKSEKSSGRKRNNGASSGKGKEKKSCASRKSDIIVKQVSPAS